MAMGMPRIAMPLRAILRIRVKEQPCASLKCHALLVEGLRAGRL
jgi:hypothetical protein